MIKRQSKLALAFILFILLNVLTLCNPQMVLGAKPSDSFMIYVTNYPENAYYVDLLVKMDKSDEHYVSFNQSQGEKYGITKESQIAIHDDGYVSYSLHFKNANSDMKLVKDGSNDFAFNNDEHFKYIFNSCRSIKVAILDQNGSIIKMSKECKLKDAVDSVMLYGAINYDAHKNQIEDLHIRPNAIMLVFIYIKYFLITWIAPLFITLVTESFIADILRIKQFWIIIGMNVVTNLSLSYYISYMQRNQFSYIKAVIIGEVFVYTFEFLFLCFVFDKIISIKALLRFTLIANTASLLIALLFQRFYRNFLEYLSCQEWF